MNQINTNKKFRYQKNKNNYINLEFFEESKQDNFYGKTSKEFYTTKGTDLIKDIFKSNQFSYPKPLELITEIIRAVSKENSIILDFFAGSGTTAHAVLELNKEDGGNRRFILCTNNENGICENVTYPRIKTVITGCMTNHSGPNIVCLYCVMILRFTNKV